MSNKNDNDSPALGELILRCHQNERGRHIGPVLVLYIIAAVFWIMAFITVGLD